MSEYNTPPFEIKEPRKWKECDDGWLLLGGIEYQPLKNCDCFTCKDNMPGQSAAFFADYFRESEKLIAFRKQEFDSIEKKHLKI